MKKQKEENEKFIGAQRSEHHQLNAMKKADIQQQEMQCMLKMNHFKK
jgi:hypothetical protein